ncbi:alpha/beta fold hydrolase [Solicola gregarius]|uniref:Alpha/beta fold hydrolase n=1 Tax=Solicola gregarius TaxID=2908642 RepID=A0AA46TLJ0_9ACTN|nr:alpha/beta fold hydrolase [Solicola gregarius]UYM07465.1 alpha/beta fold hydrolase [Solicola gregarius]
MADRVDVRVLGRVEASASGTPLALPGARARTVLATLATYVGRVVSADRLLTAMWVDGEIPESATGQLHTCVWRLRSMLGGVIETRGAGYLLVGDDVVVDARDFEGQVARGRAAYAAGRLDAAADTLAGGLALWRGPALTDVPGLASEAVRLEELRRSALAMRIDADLELGRHADLVAELSGLTTERPLDERLHGQLMTALYRSGRAADALTVFESVRARLRDELGVDPGAGLRDVHQRVLTEDLLVPARTVSPPPTRYVTSGDVHIAYQVVGEGAPDIVFVPGLLSHLDLWWDDRSTADFFTRLAAVGRLILFDKRDTGSSDRAPGAQTLEERMDDVRAVMDACGSERAVLFGYSEGGPMSLLFAATYPERVAGLVLSGASARWSPAYDYPCGRSSASMFADFERLADSAWGLGHSIERYAPSMADSARAVELVGRRERMSVSPSDFLRMLAMVRDIDVRSVLPSVQAPTLIIQRADDRVTPPEHGRFLASRLPDARYVEQPGDHVIWTGETDGVLAAVQELVSGLAGERTPERVLATVLVCEPGIVATDLVERHRGAILESAARLVATFDGPARALACARSMVSVPAGGDARVGLHVGEIDKATPVARGPAFEVAARVAALADPGTIQASRTVPDLVVGSGVAFEARGSHRLVADRDEEWEVFAVVQTPLAGAGH